jgi:predicted outer membrane repeat protein
LLDNQAPMGGAIYVGASCSLKLDSTIHFYNNTAMSASSGGAIYLGSGAQLTMGRQVLD